jgi:hypothetical protein
MEQTGVAVKKITPLVAEDKEDGTEKRNFLQTGVS